MSLWTYFYFWLVYYVLICSTVWPREKNPETQNLNLDNSYSKSCKTTKSSTCRTNQQIQTWCKTNYIKFNHFLKNTINKIKIKKPKKIQTLGQIMKFINLKLERERERSLRSKNEKALRRKREYLRTRLYKYTTQSHHTTYNLSKPTTQQ